MEGKFPCFRPFVLPTLFTRGAGNLTSDFVFAPFCALFDSQVPRPSCGRENEGPKTREFSFHDRLWQKNSLKVEKGADNWYRQHVNSHFFSDEPSISPLGAAVQLLFSLPPVWAFPSSHLDRAQSLFNFVPQEKRLIWRPC